MKTFVSCAILTIILANCKARESILFDRETEVKSYIEEEKIPFSGKSGFVFILNNKGCNTCFFDLFKEVLIDFKQNSKPKLFLLSKKDSILENQIKTVLKYTLVHTDTLSKLQLYGLDYGSDLILKYKNDKVVDFCEISNYKLSNIKVIAQNE